MSSQIEITVSVQAKIWFHHTIQNRKSNEDFLISNKKIYYIFISKFQVETELLKMAYQVKVIQISDLHNVNVAVNWETMCAT